MSLFSLVRPVSRSEYENSRRNCQNFSTPAWPNPFCVFSGENGFFLSVDLDDQVSLAAVEQPAAGALPCSRQREGIGNLDRRRQKTALENRLNRPGGMAHRAEAHADTGPERRQRQQLERRLGDDPEQTLRADEKPR